LNEETNLPYSNLVTIEDKKRINELELRALSTDELWDLLGSSVEGEAATGEDPDGKGVFNRQMLRIKKAVCENKKITDFLDSPQGGDTTNLVIVLTGALSEAKFFGIDIIAIAFLITRIGVRKLCAISKIE